MALTHPSTAFFYSGVVHFGAVEGVCLDHFDSNRLLKENFLAAACLIRRDVYMEVGGQDESLINNYEDYDFWLRLLTAGHRGMLFPEPLFHYRRHADSLRNQHLASGDTHDALLTRLRKRHPALYGGPAADRSTWKLMPAVDRARHEPVTEDFANLYRSGSGLAYESWRLPNAPAPFQPRFWNDERYHILYCIPYCCIGGAERVDLDILAALPKDVFHVTLVTIESDENKWLPRFRELVSEIVMIPNFSINATQTAAVLQYLCFSRNIDLIFNRNTHPGYVLAEGIRKITRTVTTADLLHLHDSGRDWARASAVFHDQLDARIVISKDLQNHMNSAYALPADDFTVIRNGVDTRRVLTDEQAELAARSTRSEFGIPFDAPVVGFVGRFAHQKDPLRWLAVAKTVSALLPDVHFLMVGDGDLRQDVERCVSAYGLESRVHLTGFRDDVDRIYPALSVLLMTSLYEGLPLIILEAMLHGVPVVSTATGATSECVGENVGALVAVDASPDVIAGKVIELLGRAKSDPELRNRCKRNIHDHFSLSQMQSAYRREFESLCRNRDVNQRLEDYSEWLMTNSLSW
jgi:glycosyltransferase involved in cell wall biosynthesis